MRKLQEGPGEREPFLSSDGGGRMEGRPGLERSAEGGPIDWNVVE